MNFSHPNFVYLLFATPLIVFGGVLLINHRRRLLDKIGSLELQQKVVVKRKNGYLKLIAFLAAWILVTLALMGPRGNPHYLNPQESGASSKRKLHDLLFLLDTSASMLVEDTSTSESRLSWGKQLLDRIAVWSSGDNLSLITFTSVKETLSPPTLDHLFVRMMIDQVEVNATGLTGTDIERALQYETERPTTIVLVTDGGEKEEIAKNLKGQIKLIIVGVGSSLGGVVPDETVISTLNRKALKTLGGKYVDAEGRSLIDVSDEVISLIQEDPSFDSRVNYNVQEQLRYDRYFQWPLLGALFLLGFVLFSPNTWTKAACFLLLFSHLQAESWQERRERRNEAIELMQQGKLDEAEDLLLPLSLLESEDPSLASIAREDLSLLRLTKAREATRSEAIFLLLRAKKGASGILAEQIQQELMLLGGEGAELQEKMAGDPEEVFTGKGAIAALKWAIDRATNTLQRKRAEVDPEEIQQWEAATLRAKDRFFSEALIEQREKKNGLCLCYPWKEVFPLFAKGAQAKNDERKIQYWTKALEKLTAEPKKQPEAKTEKLLQQVKEMESFDRTLRRQRPVLQGETPW